MERRTHMLLKLRFSRVNARRAWMRSESLAFGGKASMNVACVRLGSGASALTKLCSRRRASPELERILCVENMAESEFRSGAGASRVCLLAPAST
eukprot:4475591-Pleurochrysis_carterae.AAC.2